jgi:hypothetical protein
LTVDQEKSGGGAFESTGGGGTGGGGGAGAAGAAGARKRRRGVQEQTDPTWIIIITASAIPIELRLQAEEAAPVGLKLFEKCHSATTSVLMTAHPAYDD